MRKTLFLLFVLLVTTARGEKSQIQVLQKGERFEISGRVTAFGQNQEIFLPGVTVYLFSQERLKDSTALGSNGLFSFQKLEPGEYDLAFSGSHYFPQRICQIQADSTQKVYPSLELQNLEEKYPDSTWRLGRYLYVTFKSTLTEGQIIRRLTLDYDLEILPFNNNSTLQPLLRYNGETLFKATVLLPDKTEELVWADRLILDPYVYRLDPDLLLPFPPAMKTNQRPKAGKK
ncbi:MAG: hypothetical protein A2142_05545 [candidate division Zixibacteria bacterium RBG_16_48_11]|nr:MAG: hypothetical protein A2142_05545 [candidate division Zixibacteria bacterium RBG_16_48_11]